MVDMTVEQLYGEAQFLPPQERRRLAELLLKGATDLAQGTPAPVKEFEEEVTVEQMMAAAEELFANDLSQERRVRAKKVMASLRKELEKTEPYFPTLADAMSWLRGREWRKNN